MNTKAQKDLIALTGASGLVGSQIAAALKARGAVLRLGLRPSSSLRWLHEVGDFERFPFQLNHPGTFSALVAQAQTVVHCAAITRARDEATQYPRLNTEATIRLASAAAAAGVRRFVFVSSLAARGPDAGAGPDSAYGLSKFEAERQLQLLSERTGMEVLCLRLGGVYGPRDTDLLPLFRAAALGLATLPPKRLLLQPLYGEDAAEAAAAACFCPATAVPLAICEDRAYSWDSVAGHMRQTLAGDGRSLRILHLPSIAFTTAARLSTLWGRILRRAPVMDVRRGRDIAVNTWTCNTGPAERILGWKARTPLPDGLDRTWRWYRDQGWLGR